MGSYISTRAISGSRRVAIVAIMTALALVGNYSLVAIPNLELGSTILFVTAYIFGAQMAVWTTLIMSLLFGVINPWGGFIPLIWASQVLGWFYIIVIGSLMGRLSRSEKQILPQKRELAITGAIVTFIFEQITNLGYSIAIGVPFFLAVTAAIPFSIIHIVSNSIIFSQVVPILHDTLRTQLKDLIWNFDSTIEVDTMESDLV